MCRSLLLLVCLFVRFWVLLLYIYPYLFLLRHLLLSLATLSPSPLSFCVSVSSCVSTGVDRRLAATRQHGNRASGSRRRFRSVGAYIYISIYRYIECLEAFRFLFSGFCVRGSICRRLPRSSHGRSYLSLPQVVSPWQTPCNPRPPRLLLRYSNGEWRCGYALGILLLLLLLLLLLSVSRVNGFSLRSSRSRRLPLLTDSGSSTWVSGSVASSILLETLLEAAQFQ